MAGQLIHQRRRQMIRRLIQHQHVRACRQAHRQLQPPLLTLRHPPDRRPHRLPIQQAHRIRRRPHLTGRARQRADAGRRRLSVPLRRLLGQQPHDRTLTDEDRAGRRIDQPGQHRQQRRLPGPVRADEQQPVPALEPRRRRRIQAPRHRHVGGLQQERALTDLRVGRPQRQRGLRHGDPVLLQFLDPPVERLHDAGRPHRPLMFAAALAGSPTSAQPAPRLVAGTGQFVKFGQLPRMLLFPGFAFAPPPLDPSVVTAGVHAGRAIAARVEVDELGRHVAQQRPVVADHREATRPLLQGAGQVGECGGIEVVGRFVEKQQVSAGTEREGEAHPVPLPHGQRRQDALTVRRRAQPFEGDVDAPFRVPRVQPGRGIEGAGEGIVGAGFASRHRDRRGIEVLQCGEGFAVGVGDDRADRSFVGGVEVLLDDGDGARAVDDPGIRGQPTGEDVEQGSFSAAVLADDGELRARGHRQGDAVEYSSAASGDGDVVQSDVGRRSGGGTSRIPVAGSSVGVRGVHFVLSARP